MGSTGIGIAAAVSVEDLRGRARARLPRAVFDFIDGAAEDEVSLRRNRVQFEELAFVQRVLTGSTQRDQSVELFGTRYGSPFGIGPTGLAGLVWPRAELALARAAAAAKIPFALSTVASVSIEDAGAASNAPKWFQLYLLRDRGISRALVERAKAAGFQALILTVDCPVGGKRERDPRNNFTLPLRPTLRNVMDFASRPGWLWQVARNGAPRAENLVAAAGNANGAQALAAFMEAQVDPAISWQDVAEVRKIWSGPLILKGILSPEDAAIAADHGADGIILSNHGGRQLDGAVSPMAVLPYIAETLGDRLTILCDSGFRRGSDIVKATALGAAAVLLGRATLYGVGAGGEAGAAQAITILQEEVDRVLALLGASSLAQVDPSRLFSLALARRLSEQ
ncbi:alpha-hydroxy acid oxidase [Pseudaminobacter soli (ex Li et al. 2025)]|uniref:FMN hydroxy acid dehydrogenase domain-containing protein n=1 Tax=Pseudaminobacter soli (ex Li et al. 2025) TaxID=1295366 RepID=A0A2P7S3A1_9HYPH|nr:alpha-hydroxy acid oxidase [Mesorhizobium soli]PSJ56904.1 hypothetical protein C7I85_23790 [Mesorhizobium soli]